MRRATPWLVVLLGAAGLVAALLALREQPPQGDPPVLDPRRPAAGDPARPPLEGHDHLPLLGHAPGPGGSSGTTRVALPVPDLDGLLRGRVTDPHGAPLAGATVEVRPVDPQSARGAPFADGPLLATLTTTAAGTFETDAPAATWLRVSALAPGRAPAAEVVQSRDVVVELALGPAGSLVVEIVGADGAPVEGARVTLAVEAVRLQGTSGPAGDVEFAAVPPGTASLRIERGEAQSIEDGPLVIAADTTVRRLVVMPPARTVEGVVLDDADGSPIAGAEVWLARPGHSVPADPTDAEGRFGPLPAGSEAERQFVAVRADGYAPALEPVVLRGGADDTTVGIAVRLERAAPWRGRVLDARGEPVAGAEVTYTSDGVAGRPMAQATSDVGGWFTIDPPPPPAPGRRIVLHATTRAGEAALALRAGDPPPAPLELRLESDASVGGRLVLRDGSPAAGAQVRVVPVWDPRERTGTPEAGTSRRYLGNERGLASWTGATDGDGRFLVAGIPPGTWQVHVRHDGGERWLPNPFVMAAGDVDLGTQVVDEGLVLEGIVRDAGGQAVAGARVDVVLRGEPPRAVGTATDGQGAWRVAGLPIGTVEVRARRGAVASPAAVLDLDSDERRDLVLPATGALELELVDASDAPFTGIVVVRRSAATDLPARPGRPDAERVPGGRLLVADVPAGDAWFTVTALDGRVARSEAPVPIRVGEVVRRRMTLAAPARLEGQVHGADGAPAAVAEIHARHVDGRGTWLATADLRGRWRFDDVVPGRYVVGAFGRGGAPVEREIEVVAGRRTELRLDLDPAGRAEVRVVDGDGRAVPGALVRFRQGGRLVRARGPARSDGRGRAGVNDLPLGFVEVHVSHPEAGEARAEMQVVRGAPTPVTVTLRRE